jgi:hypothetical protein
VLIVIGGTVIYQATNNAKKNSNQNTFAPPIIEQNQAFQQTTQQEFPQIQPDFTQPTNGEFPPATEFQLGNEQDVKQLEEYLLQEIEKQIPTNGTEYPADATKQ